MRDKGIVVTTEEDMAQVEVECFIESCQSCSAKSLCIGQNQSKGILTVRNPLRAAPGDEVEIEIPETEYSSALIIIFGSFLLASLVGMGLGSLLAPLLPFSSSVSSLLGFLLAIVVVSFVLLRYFRAKNKAALYPVIKDIAKRGKSQRGA
jgi:positive regulator of sigma E activity